MNLPMFVKLVAAALRDEFNATVIVENERITVVFEDGTEYRLTLENRIAETDRKASAEERRQ